MAGGWKGLCVAHHAAHVTPKYVGAGAGPIGIDMVASEVVRLPTIMDHDATLPPLLTQTKRLEMMKSKAI